MSFGKKFAAWIVACYFGGAVCGPLPADWLLTPAGWLRQLLGALAAVAVVFFLGVVALWAQGKDVSRLRIRRR